MSNPVLQPAVNEPRRYRHDVDFVLRKSDFYLNSISPSRFSRFFGITGYPPIVVPLFLGSLWVIWHGPSIIRATSAHLGFLLMASLGRLLAPAFARQRSLLQYLALLLFLSWLFVWIIAGDATEADGGCYRHAPAVAIAFSSCAAAFVAPLLAKLLIGWFRGQFIRRQGLIDPENPAAMLPRSFATFGELLPITEMFFIPVKPRFALAGFLVTLLPTLTRYALPICWAVAVACILVPQQYMLLGICGSGAGAMFFFTMGNLLGERFRTMFDRVHLYLYSGAPLALSLGVIILGVCRWGEFQYVSILLNSTPGPFLILLLLASYCCLWQYQLWTREVLAEHLLGLFEDPITLRMRDRVRYPFEKSGQDPAYATNALAEHRYVQVHGGGLAVMGVYVDHSDGQMHACWESYEPFEFFDTLVSRAFRRTDVKQAVLRYRLALDLLMLVINSYLAVLNLALVFSLGGAIYYYLNVREPDPAVKLAQQVREDPSQKTVSKLLFDSSPKRVLMVAASGGGSRAALYTASLLHGLSRIGAIDDVKLTSGVSGGGAGLAYFGLHHQELCQTSADQAWNRAYEALGAPFIDEVVRGSIETRIIRGGQLGLLLTESFERHMVAQNSNTATLGTAPLAMIFNTTLCGESEWRDGRWSPPNAEDAGGRVLFTNLHPRSLFPHPDRADPQTIAWRFEVITDPAVRLTQAAAANANFPPVFANLGVAISGQHLFWITDGGAADNRGLESLLLAVKSALVDEVKQPKEARRKPPALYLIVAEASGFSMDYSHDQGLGAKMNASQQITDQLICELLDEIRGLYEELRADRGAVQFHYLAMPRVYCTRGGIATHWMLPSSTTLVDPREPDATRAKAARVTQDEIVELLKELHPATDPPPLGDPKRDIDRVRTWVGQDPHGERWRQLRKALTNEQK